MSSFPDTYNELLFSRLTRYGDGPHLSNFDKFRDTAPLRSRFLSISRNHCTPKYYVASAFLPGFAV